MEKILEGILSKIGEYLLEATVNQGRYLCCFNNIVQDLKEEEIKLKSAERHMTEEVERARNNTIIIDEDVEKWLTDASKILAEVQRLNEEIEVKKSCLSGWCPNWGCRYWLGRKAARKTTIMKRVENREIENIGHLAPLPDDTEFLATKDFELFQSSESTFEKIMRVLKDDETNLVGLYGMGGIGKTTFAKAVSKKVKEEKLFDEVIMVVVSQTPNFKNIQVQLAESLGLKLEEETEKNIAKRLYKRFTGADTETDMKKEGADTVTDMKKETKKNILVILDDVWEKFDLQATLGIPLDGDHKGCKVLLTTRLEQICIDMKSQQRIQLNVLKVEEGLALLKRHAGVGDESSELNVVAVDIAGECAGLPLALVAIGCSLKEKGINEWKVMSQKLKRSKLEDIPNCNVAGGKGIYSVLKFSYDNLKGQKTKPCFLLCSLFPEDHKIHVEELVRYAVGLGWYQDANSIEEARSELLSIVDYLKASGLLLEVSNLSQDASGLWVDAGEEYVKMHDMVRDVALWIASKGENVFMSKVGMGQIEWSKEEDWERYTAISLMTNKIEELSVSLVCPKLEILILGGENFQKKLKVSDECFKEMKALKVLSLTYVDLSLKSLRFLMNLKTLQLAYCNTRDISYLEKLKRLEILLFNRPPFDDLPSELGELHNLRLLYLDESVRIPSNVLRRCSKLEELYTFEKFREWKVGGMRKKSNASLFEITYLSHLSTLYLSTYCTCLPKDLAFPKLQRYVICVNNYWDMRSYKRALKISNIEATSLIVFEALYETLEYLGLEKVTGCQNVLPSINQRGLNELKEAEISSCDMLQEVFQLEGLHHTARMLAKLKLKNLPQLRQIWKGPTHYVNPQSLTCLSVDSCYKLEHIFPISIAQDLVRLEELIIKKAPQLKQVFYMDHARKENIDEIHETIELPKLRKLRLERLNSLTSFLPKNYHSTWPMLEELHLTNCSSLTTSFISEVKMQGLKEKLQVLEIEGCHDQLCDELTLSCLRYDFTSLEKLTINNCRVKVVFQLEGFLTTIDGEKKESSLLSLKELRLISLTELEDLAKGPKHILRLQNLSNLTVNDCPKLRHIFSPMLAGNLQLLKELCIQECKEMEHIIVEDTEEDHSQLVIFPNLIRITVTGCGKLKYLLPISMTQHLQQLEFIEVKWCYQLEKLFGHKDGAEVMNDKEIILPQLKSLSLHELPSLTSFCPMGYHFTLKLKRLSMIDCYDQINGGSFYYNGLVIVIYGLRRGLRSLEEAEGLFKVPTNILRLQDLFTLCIIQCHKLKHIFTSNLARDLLQLKKLYIYDCEELEQIIVEDDKEDHIQTPFFPNLSEIEVRGCNKLKHLFLITIVAGLPQLESICVKDCDRLQNIFEHKNGADDMNDKEIVLPQLKRLYICDCEELGQIIVEDDKEDHIQTPFFPNLSEIEVRGCIKLKHLFLVTIAAGLPQLESIYVQGCDQLQNVFGHKNGADDINDKEIVLPQLKRLSFKALPNLTNFGPRGFHFTMQLKSLEMEGCSDQMWKIYFGDWEDFSVDCFKVSEAYYKKEHVTVSFQLENGGCKYRIKSGVKESDLRFVGDRIGLDLCWGLTLTFTLQNLSKLSIDECHKMRHVFSSNLARNLWQLRELDISNCEELEQIIVEDDGDDDIRTPFFPNLTEIRISGCNKLKHVFPITMVRGGHQKLDYIDVKECDELEEVFVDGDDVIDDKQVVLSSLRFLELEKLRRLTNFCSTGYHCIFPYLEALYVIECGKMATRFSKGENRSVHAEGKPPNEGSNDDDQPTMDITYDCFLGVEENLLPYMEKK